MPEKKAWEKNSAIDTLRVLGFGKEAEMLERGEIKTPEKAFNLARERLARQQNEFRKQQEEFQGQQDELRKQASAKGKIRRRRP